MASFVTMTHLRFIFAVFIWLVSGHITSIADYRIEPGDTLRIAVLGMPQYDQALKVRADGKISYFGGDLLVAGKTPEAVNKQVREFLNQRGRLKDPIIMVSPLPGEEEIFVSGAVNAPGRYPLLLQDEIGLDHAIAMAGGPDSKADLTRVQVIRRDGTLGEYDRSPNKDYEPVFVKGGDLVRVLALGVVDVEGQVNKPGKILIRGKIRIDDALAEAGGPNNEANLSELVVTRSNGEKIKVNLSKQFWKDPKEADDSYYLYDGDILYVPALGVVDVQGQVNNPGQIFIRDGVRIGDAIARAGGLDDKADPAEVVIMRSNGEKIKVSISEQFWRAVEEEVESQHLYDGDTLYVPNAYKIEEVYVLGYVQNPGPYRVRGPVTPMQAIARAGGEAEEANLKKARIIRKDGTTQEVNLKQYNRLANSDVLLHPGDTLRIPKRFQVNWSLILSFISVTTVTVGIIIR